MKLKDVGTRMMSYVLLQAKYLCNNAFGVVQPKIVCTTLIILPS